MKSIFLALTIILSCISLNAQDTIPTVNTIENQFDEIYKTSGNYKIYKVINKVRFQNLKKQVTDSVNHYKKLLTEKQSLLNNERQNLNAVKNQADKTKLALNKSLNNENSISLFGLAFSKTKYNLLLWSLIILLIICLGYFIFKYKNSHVITKEAKNNLIDVEQEFEQHRKKTLAKEQKLRRQLQDEINKQRS